NDHLAVGTDELSILDAGHGHVAGNRHGQHTGADGRELGCRQGSPGPKTGQHRPGRHRPPQECTTIEHLAHDVISLSAPILRLGAAIGKPRPSSWGPRHPEAWRLPMRAPARESNYVCRGLTAASRSFQVCDTSLHTPGKDETSD